MPAAASPARSTSLPKRLYTYKQSAEYLACSYWTIRAMVESGRLAAVRLPGGGRLLRVALEDLDALIDSSKDPTPSSATPLNVTRVLRGQRGRGRRAVSLAPTGTA